MKKSYKLSQEQFDLIVEQSDTILRKYSANVSIVGIAWLHVLNSHPANQAKYIRVFHKRSIAAILKNVSSRAAAVIADLFLSLFSFWKKDAYKNISTRIDTLFLSHLVNAKATKSDPDFYYQELPEYLQARKHKTAVALLNHTKNFKEWDNSEIGSVKRPAKFLVPRRLGFSSELRLLGRSLETAFFFLKQASAETNSVKKTFFIELAANVFSVDTLRAFRMYDTVQYILKHTNTKVLALTWEGHSWERLACYAANTASRKILCIGYQHTILFPSSHALKRSIGQAYDPDIILTVGSVTKKIMESSPGLENVIIKEYGSPRLKVKRSYERNKPLQNGCLVAPEGLIDECIRLFTFGIETARLMPEIKFIFRTHPTMRFDDLQGKDIRLQNLPKNIIISSFKNIDDDFNRCSWVIYRSSSVSFFAALAGARPVYLQLADELTIDPLYALNSWRLQVSYPEEMAAIIHNDRQTSMEEKAEERKDAVAFCEAYMVPYNVSVFEECISEQNRVDQAG